MNADKLVNSQKVNVALLTQVRDWLAKGGQQLKTPFGSRDFDYQIWDCGTHCCVGGALGLLAGKQPRNSAPVARAVGLDAELAEALFYPGEVITGSGKPAYLLSAQEVAKLLTGLIERNVLDFGLV